MEDVLITTFGITTTQEIIAYLNRDIARLEKGSKKKW